MCKQYFEGAGSWEQPDSETGVDRGREVSQGGNWKGGKKVTVDTLSLSASLALAGSLQVALGRTAQVVLVLVLLSECQVGKRGGSGVGGSHSQLIIDAGFNGREWITGTF